MFPALQRQADEETRLPDRAGLVTAWEQPARDRQEQLAVVRVDEVEMMNQLVGEGVPSAVHHLHPEAVDESVLRDLERRDGWLRERMVRRVRGQVDRRQVEDERDRKSVV